MSTSDVIVNWVILQCHADLQSYGNNSSQVRALHASLNLKI